MHGQAVCCTGTKPDLVKWPSMDVLETNPVLQGSKSFQSRPEESMSEFESLPADKIVLTEVSNVEDIFEAILKSQSQ